MNESTAKTFALTLSFTLLGILILLIGIYYQISKINDANKVNLTYKIYTDVLQWEKEHPEVSDWIAKPDSLLTKNYDKWDFDDYLSYYEALYALREKNLVDKKLTDAMFSYELEHIYEANHYELKAIIDSMRLQDNDPEIYLGVEKLYNDFHRDRKFNTPPSSETKKLAHP